MPPCGSCEREKVKREGKEEGGEREGEEAGKRTKGDWHVGQIQQTAFCDLPSVSSPFSTKKVCLGVI